MRKVLIVLTLGLTLAFASATAQVIPTNVAKQYYGEATYNNDVPLPVGSIVDAYDDDGVHCGTFTLGDVVQMDGIFGFMNAYGDDIYTPARDEGAEPGEMIYFKVNGRDAAATLENPGSERLEWYSQELAKIDLSATDFTFGMMLVDPPSDQSGEPGTTLRFQVGVENTGNGIDFYTIEAISGAGWTINVPDTFVYAGPGETAYIWFDVELQLWGGPQFDNISYTVHSQTAMPAASVSGSVSAIRDADAEYNFIFTDTPDDTSDVIQGTTVPFTVGIQNTGNVPDNYSISVSSHLGWTIINPLAFLSLDPDSSGYMSFEVEVPADAPELETDTITFTVHSGSSPSVTLTGSFDMTTALKTDVGDNPGSALPSSMTLHQNYPNPFNPTTTIGYSLATRASVSLTVFDVSGRAVRTVDLGTHGAGDYTYEFDGSDLSSGVYFYRIATSEMAQTRKMVLVK